MFIFLVHVSTEFLDEPLLAHCKGLIVLECSNLLQKFQDLLLNTHTFQASCYTSRVPNFKGIIKNGYSNSTAYFSFIHACKVATS
jgi:hypothetical protein